jgi:hypothetical protein|tara:strand:+ start:237 stop:932 length:696 start_codon:yes stop_codon:yes gene_type:complete
LTSWCISETIDAPAPTTEDELMSTRLFAVFFVAMMFPLTATSQASKFELNGSTLIYDTSSASNEQEQEITWEDVDELDALLKSEQSIKEIELNSAGGDVEAAFYMADLIIDYELDTNVKGTCESACTLMLLAGERRTVERGSWVGFHQSYWDAPYIQGYFERNKDSKGWSNAFEFASWMYEDTQREVLRNLQYFVERGVDAGFAIKTMKATSDDMWYPRRKELEAAGVIVE